MSQIRMGKFLCTSGFHGFIACLVLSGSFYRFLRHPNLFGLLRSFRNPCAIYRRNVHSLLPPIQFPQNSFPARLSVLITDPGPAATHTTGPGVSVDNLERRYRQGRSYPPHLLEHKYHQTLFRNMHKLLPPSPGGASALPLL